MYLMLLKYLVIEDYSNMLLDFNKNLDCTNLVIRYFLLNFIKFIVLGKFANIKQYF